MCVHACTHVNLGQAMPGSLMGCSRPQEAGEINSPPILATRCSRQIWENLLAEVSRGKPHLLPAFRGSLSDLCPSGALYHLLSCQAYSPPHLVAP